MKVVFLKDAFEPFLAYEKQKGKTEKTIFEHRRLLFGSLSHSISEKKIADLTLSDSAKVQEAGRVHGEYGAQRSVVVFRLVLQFIKECGQSIPFDWRDLKLPRVPKKAVEYLTEEELDKIRNSFNLNTLIGLRTRTLIEVLLDTGMRIGEAVSLNREDINWETKEALITNIKTKDKGETVYFTDRSLEWIKKYLSMRADNFPPLFAGYQGERIETSGVRRALKATTRSLGIKKQIRPHIFRRTLATKLLQNQVDIKSVQTIMRHKSERTTLRYYTGINKDLVKAMHQKIMA